MQRATRNAIGQRAGRRGRHRGRGPPGTSAPTIMHNVRHVRTPCPNAPCPRTMHTRHAHTPCPHPCTRHARTMPTPMHTHHGAHGRARRPRRAAPTGTTSGTTSGTRAAGDVGPHHHAPCTPCPRTMHTPCPYPCTRTMAPMVGRAVPGAPRPRGGHRGRHVYADRRGRRPLPTCTIRTMSTHHAHAMPAPMHTRHSRTPAPWHPW